ncbi:MAG: HDOD domain-containing protein [Actinomycetota bacterium]
MFGRNKKAERRFEHLLDEGGIPSFPNAVADAIQQVASPDVDLGEVAETISMDPKLTVAVLKLANSPSFAPRSPIRSVHQAAVLLGRNQLESLLIASGVGEAIPPRSAPGYSPAAFWLTSATRAAAAAGLAARLDPAAQYEQFTAALLQDMAQPILVHNDEDYAKVLVEHGAVHADLVVKEEEVLGWTHPEIGELLGGEWGLPEGLTQSISVHHDQPVAGYEIAQWASLIELPEPDLELLAAEAERRLGLNDPEAVPAVIAEAMERAAEIAAVFN